MTLLAATLATTIGLDAILNDPALSGAQVGVCVTDNTGKLVYERNGKTRFVPASNQKVPTVLLALEKLGPDFGLSTKVWKEDGRVVVDSWQDPLLTLADLRTARKALWLFDDKPVHVYSPFMQHHPPGWEWDDLPWYYAVKTSPFAFDQGAFEVWTGPKGVEKLAPEIGVKTQSFYTNRKPQSTLDLATNTLIVTGPNSKERTSLGRFAQPDPFAAACRALGGKGERLVGDLPRRPPDHVTATRRLSEAAKKCLEDSDNAIAERLLRMTLGETFVTGDSVTLRLQKDLLLLSGVKADLWRPVDGSGLSRHNQLSPMALCQMLNWARSRPWWPVFKSCLPAGGEGTLKNRLKDSSFVGKTGTMDAVVSLSGYVTTQEGKSLTVSFLVNNSNVPASEVRSVQDKFIRAIESGQASDGLRATIFRPDSDTLPYPRHRVVDVRRISRPHRHRSVARSGADRRAEPPHAPVHRAQ